MRFTSSTARRHPRPPVAGQALRDMVHERLAGGGAKLPEPGVGDAGEWSCSRVSVSPSSGLFHRPPSKMSAAQSPSSAYGRVGHMSDGHFVGWPVRK